MAGSLSFRHLLLAVVAGLSLSGCEVMYRSQMRQATRDYQARKIGAAEYNRTMAELSAKLEGYTRAAYAVGNAGFAASAQIQASQRQPVPVVVVRQPPAQPQLLQPSATYNVQRVGPDTYQVQRSGIPLVQ